MDVNTGYQISTPWGTLYKKEEGEYYRGLTSLAYRNYTNIVPYQCDVYTDRFDSIKTKTVCLYPLSELKEEYIDGDWIIPKMAFLQGVDDIKNKGRVYEQILWETLLHFYLIGDEEFPDRVREINRKEKVVTGDDLEYYLQFWGIGSKFN